MVPSLAYLAGKAIGFLMRDVPKKLSLDDAASFSPKIEVDTNVKVEGKASLKITIQWPTTVCLGDCAVQGPSEMTIVQRCR